MMSMPEEPRKRLPVLVEPRFRHPGTDDSVQPPTVAEIVSELLHVLNLKVFPTYKLLAANFFCYLLTSLLFIVFSLNYLSLSNILFAAICVVFVGTLYNSVWFHRYCCHSAFEFKKAYFSYLFLWTNPLSFIFREEVYAIPHRIHHEQTEKAADPYGPHLGWLGSFLSTELTQRLNTDITEKDYEWMKSSIHHIGLRVNDFQRFTKTGSIENVVQYSLRVIFAQLFWVALIYSVGGFTFVLSWYASIFITASLIRDFNWRGHGGSFHRVKKPGWEFGKRSYALNQRFYGYIASEWHDNHHKYPTSANNGFLPGQIDIAFSVIQFLQKLGFVQSCIDSFSRFKDEQLHVA